MRHLKLAEITQEQLDALVDAFTETSLFTDYMMLQMRRVEEVDPCALKNSQHVKEMGKSAQDARARAVRKITGN